MRQIDLYLLRQLLLALGVLTGVTCLLLVVMALLRYVEDLVERGLTFDILAALVGLALPSMLEVALPLALFAAILFVHYRVAADSELVAMRASGVGDLRLALPALLTTVLVALAVAWISLWLAPNAARASRDILWEVRNYRSAFFIRPGAFTPLGKGVTLYVRDRLGVGEYAGIMVQDDRGGGGRVTYMANRGSVVDAGGKPRLVALDGNRQEVDRETGRLTLIYFDRYGFEMNTLGPRQSRKHRERPLAELLDPPVDEIGAARVGRFKAEGHHRLAGGLYALAVGFAAIACALLAGPTRRDRVAANALAVLLAFGAMLSGLAVKSMVGRLPALWPLLYLVPLLVAGGGLAALALGGPPWRVARRAGA